MAVVYFPCDVVRHGVATRTQPGCGKPAEEVDDRVAFAVSVARLAGNPAILTAVCRTGGFASPPRDGFAVRTRIRFVAIVAMDNPSSCADSATKL
jgi:hypothetical protein